MKTLLLTMMLLATTAQASTDFSCMDRCSENGYMYSYCKSQCTYNEYVPVSQEYNPPIKSTDYNCVNDCTAQGSLYGYCKKLCSY